MGTFCGQWAEFFAIRIGQRLNGAGTWFANWVELRQSKARARLREAERARAEQAKAAQGD